jgi:general secretion pathway protein G
MVELLIVMAIIAMLSTIAMTSYAKIKTTAQISRAKVEIRGMEREINAYATEKGAIPANLDAINRQGQKDPWGQEYVYNPDLSVNSRTDAGIDINIDFDLFSKGVDGQTEATINTGFGIDDIIRGMNGAFVDIATEWI